MLDQYQRRLQRHSANAERRNHLDAQHESQRQIWLEAVNAELSQVEQVKKWTLLPHEFTAGAELTPTLKVKRKVVNEEYASQISALYAAKA